MAKPENLKCPKCHGPMTPKKSSFGAFWGCKSYPSCNGTRDVNGDSQEDRDKARYDRESDYEY